MNKFKTTLCLLFLIFTLLPNLASSSEKDIWVAVTVFEGRNVGASLPEYYGIMSKETYEKLTTEVKEGMMFKLDSVFWTNDEGTVVHMSDAKKHGRPYGYTNEIYFRADHIYRIVVVEEKFIKNILK